ncbi:MAG TPA: hypothetical protein VI337_01500 [Nitrospirales bacterium]|nr:hypothetical protein [Nitrospirales bacterium]
MTRADRPPQADQATTPKDASGFVQVPVGKAGCVLVLTEAEYLRGIRRGKWWRRRDALRRRGDGER